MTTAPQSMGSAARAPVPDRLTTTLLALVLPLAALIANAAVTSGWRHELPDPIAIHWSGSAPDGFGSFSSFVWPMLGIGALFCIGMWALGFWAGRAASTRRVANATSLWFAVFLAVLTGGSLAAQRGLADAADAGSIDGVLLVALAVSTLAAALAAWVTPGDRPQPAGSAGPADATRLALPATVRATWIRTATSRVGIGAGIAAAASVLTISLVAQLWTMVALAFILTGLCLAMFRWHLRVDSTGFLAFSALGWPRVHIPVEEIVTARTTTVHPIGDFGGWGWRIGRGGATGIVLRRGEAIEIERTGGRTLVVTTDDAATAAALLNTIVERFRTRS
ncbi:MAG: DUF1648 domain-containing protein [Cellulomonadaceae bacterium]